VRAHPARGPAVSTGDRGSNTRARGTTATEAPRKVSAALAVSECGNPIREAARPQFTDLDRLYHLPPGGHRRGQGIISRNDLPTRIRGPSVDRRKPLTTRAPELRMRPWLRPSCAFPFRHPLFSQSTDERHLGPAVAIVMPIGGGSEIFNEHL